jgi:GNAT superfamily N-acetyltransferase
MTISMRNYEKTGDFQRISEFLIRHYQPGNRDGNWLQPTWEYMHSHPMLDESALDRIGIWEYAAERGSAEIVAVVHYESFLGEVFFQLHPEYSSLKPEMLNYAEEQLYGTSETGQRFVHAFVNDFDEQLIGLVQSRGYHRQPDHDRIGLQLVIPDPFPEITLPEGFRLKSLQEENDLHKIHRVLWRGFNHPGKPPEDELDGRRKMQSGPNFRVDLNIVVAAPDGNFVSYSGTWFEGVNRYCYVEPVATDPDYRRRGLGRAAVLEGIRRCGELGATVAYVGSDQNFYLSMGFRLLHNSQCWRRELQIPHS